MNPSFLAILRDLVEKAERELGRKLTLDEQNALKDQAMHQALMAASRTELGEPRS